MTAFSASDAAFAGFRLIRERPRTLLVWAALYLGVAVVSGVLVVTLAGEHLAALEALNRQGAAADMEAAMGSLIGLSPFLLAALPLTLGFYAVMYAAAYRAILAPEDPAPGSVRLGADEARMAGFLLMFALAGLAYLFVTAFAFALVSALVASALGGATGAGVVSLAAAVGIVAALIYPAVRLSLAAPASFMHGRIRLFSAWSLTRGRFWPLFNAYGLATILVVVVSLLGLLIFLALAGALLITLGGAFEDLGAIFQPQAISLATYFTPLTVAYMAFNALMSSAAFAILVAPSAEAYRAFAAEDAEV